MHGYIVSKLHIFVSNLLALFIKNVQNILNFSFLLEKFSLGGLANSILL